MKNGIIKTITTLGIAGLMLTGAAGCSMTGGMDMSAGEKDIARIELADDKYVAVTENGICTLHKGDVFVLALDYTMGGNLGYGHSLTTEIQCDCGYTLQTPNYAIYETRPSEDKYSVLCSCAEK